MKTFSKFPAAPGRGVAASVRRASRLSLSILPLAGLLLAGCAGDPSQPGPPPARPPVSDSGSFEAYPLSVPGSYLAGMFAERHGKIGPAGDFLLHALEKDPENVELLNRAFILLIEEGRWEEVERLSKRIMGIDPTAVLPIMVLAIRDVLNGKLHRAEIRLREIPLQGFNKHFQPLLLAWVLAGQGYTDAALKVLDPLKETSGFAMLRDLHVGLILDMAGRPGAAEESFVASLAGGVPGSFRLVETYGAFFERIGRPEKAKEIYDAYRESSPDLLLIAPLLARMERGDKPQPVVRTVEEGLAEALFNISSALHQEGAAKMALIYVRMALRLRPDFPIAQVLLAEIFEMQGRNEAAIATYEIIKPGTPYRWMADLRIAINLDALERADEAIDKLRLMTAERPERTDALISLGDILRARERFDEAILAYDKAVELIGVMEERHWSLLYARGIALERAKKWPRAETDLLRALELKPDQPFVLNYLGYSWVDQGVNIERARKMIERAVELRPSDGFIIDSLGWVLYMSGEYEEAVRELERATELRPQDATINDHLGDAYWRVGRIAEARFQWERALALKPEPDVTAAIEEKLLHGLAESKNGRGS